ncbi:MAG: SMC-Scp complex subunit ScpB [Dehalococcoidia bacterium]
MKQAKQPQKTIDRPPPERLPALIESLLFVAQEPQDIGTLAKSFNVPRQGIEKAVETLIDSTNGRGLFVQRLGDKVQLATVPDAAPYIEHFLEVDHGRLSRASLETLAIIAYRQPVTRGTIESVRGVNSDHSVATLLARELIEEAGRAPGPGRAVLLATSVRFLEYFGLQRAEDLPALPLDEAQLAALAEAESDGVLANEDGEPASDDDVLADEDSESERADDLQADADDEPESVEAAADAERS